MNIIVTGASKGIGKSLVKSLASTGSPTIICIARSEDKLKKIKEDCEKINTNSKIIPLPFDLENTELIKSQLMNSVREHFFSLDILVNNAGYLRKTPLDELSYQEILKHYKVNVFTPFELIKGTLSLFHSSPVKHIVNIGTMGGINGTEKFPGMAAYSSAKGALSILSELLACELKGRKIHINYLALGAVETDMFREAFPGEEAKLKPEDIAEFIAHFAKEEWKYFNGKIIPVSLE